MSSRASAASGMQQEHSFSMNLQKKILVRINLLRYCWNEPMDIANEKGNKHKNKNR